MSGFAGLARIDDPRTPMQRARKSELLAFAKANGVADVNENMPADVIRLVLTQRGLTNIRVPNRPLGMPKAAQDAMPQLPAGNSVDATAHMLKQYQSGAYSAPAEEVETVEEKEFDDAIPLEKRKINHLRHNCIALGLKLGRKTTKQDMLDMLNGKDAAERDE